MKWGRKIITISKSTAGRKIKNFLKLLRSLKVKLTGTVSPKRFFIKSLVQFDSLMQILVIFETIYLNVLLTWSNNSFTHTSIDLNHFWNDFSSLIHKCCRVLFISTMIALFFNKFIMILSRTYLFIFFIQLINTFLVRLLH